MNITNSRTGLTVEIDDATQYATIRHADGRPAATMQRRRVLDRASPRWRVFDLSGLEIGTGYNYARPALNAVANITLALGAE